MTPEERAHADAVQASLEKMITGRKKRPPEAATAHDKIARNSLYTAALFVFATALLLAAIIAWKSLPPPQNTPIITQAQATPEQPAPTPTPITPPAPRTVTLQAEAQPAPVEYNVVREYTPRPRPTPIYAPAPVAAQTTSAITAQDHVNFALQQAEFFLNSQEYANTIGAKSLYCTNIKIEEATYEQLWNKYRNTGSATISYYTAAGNYYQKVERFEVVTQVKNGSLALATNIEIK